jgi:hypothetical protein
MGARVTGRGERPGALVTVPPLAGFIEEVAAEPIVQGLRLNTVMPIKGTPRETLERLVAAAKGKPLFVDLKARQLRVAEAAVPPFTSVRLSHRISLATPARAVFSGGREHARVLAVDGDRLLLEDGPRRVLGPGESVNIPDATLEVLGDVLTDRDREYLAAMRELGLRDVMLSFVERDEDVDAVRALLPDARVVAKVESVRGVAWARERGPDHVRRGGRLMAARGDLFVEVRRPHDGRRAVKDILAADPRAVVASRLCDSLAWSVEPTCQDISDVAWCLGAGARTLMLGDEVCLKRDAVLSAIHLVEAIVDDLA